MTADNPRILRVFPRRTKATPRDPFVSIGEPGLFDRKFAVENEIEAVHVSVTFTWDLPAAERIARAWAPIAPVKIGGPALDDPGGEFEPGRYLAPGYTITSRGCPERCGFCFVPRREGPLRELEIKPGWNVLDNNLLACSEAHIRAVFAMLAEQPHRAAFTGGLQASRLEDWHVDLLAGLAPRPAVYFAMDRARDFEPLRIAAGKLWAAGFTEACHRVRCYVLIGHPGDSPSAAESRLQRVLALGITPMAMLHRSAESEKTDRQWRDFQRDWARPALIHGGARS